MVTLKNLSHQHRCQRALITVFIVGSFFSNKPFLVLKRHIIFSTLRRLHNKSYIAFLIFHLSFFFNLFLYLAMPRSTWDLTRIEPVPPAVEAWSLSHWTAREVPIITVYHRLLDETREACQAQPRLSAWEHFL